MMLPIKSHLIPLKRVKNTAGIRLGFLRLDKNENIIPFPKKIVSAIHRAFDSAMISAYPEVGPLYAALARHNKCAQENVYLTAGSDAAIKAVFEVFVAPNDTVLLLSPTYAMFYVYARMFQARLKEIFYQPDLSISVDAMRQVIEQDTPRLVCIANPNSPTGTVIPPAELESIVRLAQEKGAVILMDEAYHMFYPKTCAPWIARYENLVITRTFSKALGLAAGRLGYALGSPAMISCLYKTRPMYEANAFALQAAQIILNHFSSVKKTVAQALEGKKYLEERLRKEGFAFLKSYANFVLIDMGSPQRALQVADVLKKKKILVKTGFDTPLKKYLRVNIGSRAQMQKFLTAFFAAAKRIGKNG